MTTKSETGELAGQGHRLLITVKKRAIAPLAFSTSVAALTRLPEPLQEAQAELENEFAVAEVGDEVQVPLLPDSGPL